MLDLIHTIQFNSVYWPIKGPQDTQDTSPYLWLLPKFDVTTITIGKASCWSIINCSNQPELKILNEAGNYMRKKIYHRKYLSSYCLHPSYINEKFFSVYPNFPFIIHHYRSLSLE